MKFRWGSSEKSLVQLKINLNYDYYENGSLSKCPTIIVYSFIIFIYLFIPGTAELGFGIGFLPWKLLWTLLPILASAFAVHGNAIGRHNLISFRIN